MFHGFKGLNNLAPSSESKSFDEPNVIGYTLNEAQFEEKINSQWKIEYDVFQYASIVLSFNASKDIQKERIELSEIRISFDYSRQSGINETQEISLFLSNKSNNEQVALSKCLDYKEKMEKSNNTK